MSGEEGPNWTGYAIQPQAFVGGSLEGRVEEQKKLVEELKVQWKLLWSERFDDKVRAEGVSVNDYAVCVWNGAPLFTRLGILRRCILERFLSNILLKTLIVSFSQIRMWEAGISS